MLTKQTYGNGKYVDFVYDNLDRLFQKKYNGVTKLEYAYNASGDLASMIDYFADKQQFYTYDLSGRLVEAYTKDLSTNSLYTHTVFDYIDAKNLLGGKTVYLYGGSTVPQFTLAETYTYGNQAAGEIPEALYGISLNGEEILSYAYDSLGRLVTKTLDKAGINTTYTYKDIGTDGKTTTLVSEYTTNGKNFLYTYDSLGNITEVRVASVEADMYEYDELSRLVRVNSDPGAYNDGVQTGLPESKTVAYEYDDSGNILSKKTYGWTLAEDLTTLTPTETITYTYGDSQWKDLLTNYNGTAITYDTIGNPANWRDGMTFSWANGRQLQSVTSGTKTYSFEYNADGIRTHKNNPDSTQSVEYILDESGRIAGLKRHNVWVATYVYDENDSPIGMRLGTTEYWFVKNLQGDIIEVVNNAGTVLANYYYDEWGVPTAVYKGIVGERLVGKNNIFLYRGYVYDWETGLYYLNSRYYDPVVGRFINADRLVSGVGNNVKGYNQFGYCFNNPVNMSDETGNWPILNNIKNGIKKASKWINEKIISPTKKFYGGVKEDLKNFDVNNESEDVVLESNYFSIYKGVLALRIGGDRSGSFGAMFITKGSNYTECPEDVVRHEYGHTVQLRELGIIDYALWIGIPSWKVWGEGDYYDKPWEVTADVFGGVKSRTPDSSIVAAGLDYLVFANEGDFSDWIDLFGEELS